MTGEVSITVNGASIRCAVASTVATALITCGYGPSLRKSEVGGEPRGLFCGMGVCFDCLVTIDGSPGQRACMAIVRDGMRIETS